MPITLQQVTQKRPAGYHANIGRIMVLVSKLKQGSFLTTDEISEMLGCSASITKDAIRNMPNNAAKVKHDQTIRWVVGKQADIEQLKKEMAS